ncbi:hypothetical protein QE363_000732 [Sphingomonas sp. SORGH_AS870]|uniref:GPO family capsid scaffolding protein n=1 Tax=Sphingomonas sp. SORGH_AS_0870 TaxID=3041801 RepID=UPI00285D8102|nr:GPO family capsid scaffolding protein [Sphingomonas sp. SORGH_AS_0870]MDR6144939.1 hypothetical protein [Sphingomonas sp. SORGH_AS_0870]
MGKKSNFFRAFVAGQTISDGRVVTPEMIDQIVETFNLDTYTPRINVEHIAGYSPEPPFNGYGDVIAVKKQLDEFTIAGNSEKRAALYLQVDGNDQLFALSKRDQKPFPSVELTPNYAGTDKVGLIGLAFTDTPASIGTQRLSFSRVNGTMLSTATDRAEIAFTEEADGKDQVDNIVNRLFSKLTGHFKQSEPEKPKDEAAKPANDNFDPGKFTADIQTAVAGSISAALAPIAEAQAKHQQEFADLKAKLEGEPQTRFSRQPVSGGGADIVTDC